MELFFAGVIIFDGNVTVGHFRGAVEFLGNVVIFGGFIKVIIFGGGVISVVTDNLLGVGIEFCFTTGSF